MNEATWPTYTNKCYYDAYLGYWEYVQDADGNCLDPFEFEFQDASSMIGLQQLAALDYYYERPDPIDDDNYGWYDSLEWDEYPLEIQCSSCFLWVFLVYGQSIRLMKSQTEVHIRSGVELGGDLGVRPIQL